VFFMCGKMFCSVFWGRGGCDLSPLVAEPD
jgi:hypothetical protein